MICRLTGRIVGVHELSVVVEVGGFCYEVLVPSSSLADLQRLDGNEVTLFTIQYLEGNPAVSNLVPRIIGFLSEADREFFNAFTRVKGVSMRKALRAMSLPAHQLAAAIEQADVRTLTGLPEIGEKTATRIVAELRGRLERFLAPAASPLPVSELTEAQKVALEILVQWGDKRSDAQRWIAAAVAADQELSDPEEIVRTAYRAKHGAT